LAPLTSILKPGAPFPKVCASKELTVSHPKKNNGMKNLIFTILLKFKNAGRRGVSIRILDYFELMG
jgi:hypothetical protein